MATEWQNPAQLVYSEVLDSAAITTTAVKTAFSKTYTIPANSLSVGDVIRVRAKGDFNDGAGGTFAFSIRIGGVDVAAILSAAGPASSSWQVEADAIIRVIGAAGVFNRGFGGGDVGGAAPLVSVLVGSIALDTSVAQVVDVTTTMSVANINNNSTLHSLSVEILKAGQTS